MATLKNTSVNDTGYLQLPVGTTAERPVTPANGYMRYNTTTGYGEVYNASVGQWLQFGTAPTLSVEYLVVAGGGGSSVATANDAGSGGGGNGASASSGSSPQNGTDNRGGGGGGAAGANYAGGYTSGSGGSGVVVFRVGSSYTVSISVGITYSLDTSSPGYKIYTCTSGTGSVTIT